MRTHGYLTFAVGLCITVATCLFVMESQDARLRGNFARDAEKVASDTNVRLNTYFDMLLSLKGMFAVSGDVDRAQFDQFVRELRLTERYPGFQAIQFVRAVPDADLARYQKAVRLDTTADPQGYPGFTVHPPATPLPLHYVIEFNEPMKGNENAFGLDLATLPPHREAIEAARDNNEVVATARIILVQDKTGQPGFVARAPVYRKGMPLQTVEQRRAAFIGAVAIVFRVSNLMREVIDPALLRHMSLRIDDAGDISKAQAPPPGPDTLMYQSAAGANGLLPLAAEAHIDVTQRQWILRFTALQGSRYSRDITSVVLIGLGGLVISALMSALMIASRRSRILADQLRLTLEEQRASLVKLGQQKSELELAHADLSAVLVTLKQAQANLITSEKMASLGSLVAGIAHELNTPIGNSLLTATALADMSADFEKRYLEGGVKRSVLEAHIADTRHACTIMANSLRRAADLITSFKQVAVDQTSDLRRRFDLSEVVRDTLATYAAQLRRANCEAEVEVPPMELDSYPGGVGQVLSNLINNALLHAFEGRGRARIVISAREIENDQVMLNFSDDGVGMSAKTLHQVFDPFFTTKMGQGGSGLGMNIVYNIVTGMLGGTIGIASTEGSGTSITMRFPRKAPKYLADDVPVTRLIANVL